METRTSAQSQHIELTKDRLSAHRARQFVHETLARWDCTGVEDEVSLAVSELVTNAVIHGHSATTLTLLNRGDTIQIRVRDEEPMQPKLREPTADSTGGRGILLVEAISADWGVESDPPGKIVWLDITKR